MDITQTKSLPDFLASIENAVHIVNQPQICLEHGKGKNDAPAINNIAYGAYYKKNDHKFWIGLRFTIPEPVIYLWFQEKDISQFNTKFNKTAHWNFWDYYWDDDRSNPIDSRGNDLFNPQYSEVWIPLRDKYMATFLNNAENQLVQDPLLEKALREIAGNLT
jgi:hypothetical protein